MTLVATKFTPEVLLSAPRRSAAVPNSAGTLALYTVSTYSFGTHSRSAAIKVLDIDTGNSTTLSEEQSYSEPTWLNDSEFLLLKSGEKGTTSLLVADATVLGSEPREIKTFDGSLSNLKTATLDDGTVAVVVSAPTTPSGELYSTAKEAKPLSSGRVYTKLYVRHWDTYVTENKSSLWYGALKKAEKSGIWTFASPNGGLVNALQGTKLECPVPPFGGTGDFALSKGGLAFVASDPELNSALWTKSDLYYVPLQTFTEAKPPAAQQVQTGHLQGYSGSPAFSHSGKSLAFKRMRHRQYESDKWRLLLIPDVKDLANVQEFYRTDDGVGAWDSRPESIVWSHDEKELFVTAEDKGKVLLYRLPSSTVEANKALPTPITSENSIGDIFNLNSTSSKMLATSTSLVDNSSYSIIDPSSGDASTASITLVSSACKSGKSFGLSKSQVSSIWFQGAGDYQVHALVMRPSDFDPAKKYPLALLIHGGPQGAWNESWSTRWNPAVYAEQGYVTVMPNPTGSTGYGQALTDAIAGNWGGRPYQDIELCFAHIEQHLPYVDTSRAVGLGASYGGYMINWVQGHPLGRKLKALVCHDGIFSTMSDWATEELFFTIHDMQGTLWDNRAGYERWDPAAFTGEWATPELIIHSELDYRLPVTEGLAAFNVLQTRGVDSRLLIFPDENHWVLKPENSLLWHKEVLGWINKYVGLDTTGLAGDTENLNV